VAGPLANAALAFFLAFAIGPAIIAFLSRRGYGKDIRPEGPESHQGKSGTPTMGGIMVIIPVLASTVLLNNQGRSILVPVWTMVLNGIIGAGDDLGSLVGRGQGGYSARTKFVILLLLAVAIALVLHYGLLLDSIYMPFQGRIPIGFWYVPIAALTIVATANAVNLTDGLDTLAGGTSGLAFAAYGIIAFLQEQNFLATFSFTVVGSLLGFLWYNAHPAQVFMGDTGSLALGAALAVVAMMTGHWLLLPLVGIVFVAEALSVIVQVVYFKLSGGKRLLRMSPLHHHFELSGWSEPQVTVRFWIIGMIAAMLAIALALA
jgi:phospho-N-acetylmuramoyl-pentapeptide-transferase